MLCKSRSPPPLRIGPALSLFAPGPFCSFRGRPADLQVRDLLGRVRLDLRRGQVDSVLEHDPQELLQPTSGLRGHQLRLDGPWLRLAAARMPSSAALSSSSGARSPSPVQTPRRPRSARRVRHPSPGPPAFRPSSRTDGAHPRCRTLILSPLATEPARCVGCDHFSTGVTGARHEPARIAPATSGRQRASWGATPASAMGRCRCDTNSGTPGFCEARVPHAGAGPFDGRLADRRIRSGALWCNDI